MEIACRWPLLMWLVRWGPSWPSERNRDLAGGEQVPTFDVWTDVLFDGHPHYCPLTRVDFGGVCSHLSSVRREVNSGQFQNGEFLRGLGSCASGPRDFEGPQGHVWCSCFLTAFLRCFRLLVVEKHIRDHLRLNSSNKTRQCRWHPRFGSSKLVQPTRYATP